MKRPGFWDGGVLVLEEVRQQPFLQPCLFRNTPDTAVPPGFQFRLSCLASELEVDSGLVLYALVLCLTVVRQPESCSLGCYKTHPGSGVAWTAASLGERSSSHQNLPVF